MQESYDLWVAHKKLGRSINRIEPVRATEPA